MKIAILESLGIPSDHLDALKAPFEQEGHSFTLFERTSDIEILIREAKDAGAVILANMPFPEKAVRACPDLKFIDIAFTGVDHVAVDAAKECGITVSNASGYSTEAVSELAVGLALSLLRELNPADTRCRSLGTKDGLRAEELAGKTVGIIGLGKIGMRSAELFRAFGCRILAASRTVHPSVPDYVDQVSKETLLKDSDIVLLHCPLNASTRGLIGKEELGQMKRSAFLINLARGPVVRSEELAEALHAGTIAGAALDVFDREPPLDLSDPLLHAPNTILTPHLGFATRESMLLRAAIVFDNLRAFLDGRPVNVV